MKNTLYLTLNLLLLVTFGSYAQATATIKGRITTSDNKPADYVSVSLNDKTSGTLTNANGNYIFNKLKAGTYLIKVSAVGLSPQNQTVNLKSGETLTINFMLNENAQQLKEVNINSTKNNKFIVKQSETVNKMPLTQLENSQVYTSISKDLMTEQLVFSADDALRNAPGVQTMWQATSRSGDGGSYFNSRGFIVQSKFRNGISGIVTSVNDAANIEKVEVIKGPSATLFGSAFSTYGGLINRTTKKPFDSFGGEISNTYGNYDFSRVSVDANTPIDAGKKLLFRLNTSKTDKGSFQDAGFSKRIFIAPSLSYQATDRLLLSFDVELNYGKGTGDQFIFFNQPVSALGVNSAEKVNIDYRKAYFSNELVQNSQSNNFYGQAVYKISDQWTSQTNFSSSGSYSNGHGPYFYLVPGNLLSRNDQATSDSKAYSTEAQQNFNGDFKIGGLRNRFVGGLDFTRINSKQFFYGATLPVNVSTIGTPANYYDFNLANLNAEYAKVKPNGYYTYPYAFSTNTYSTYIADVLNLTDNLLASAGLRIDRFDNQSSKYKQTAYSPKFGLVYQPVKDVVSIFGNYQNGFVNQNGQDFSGTTFKPEKANQTEGGIKLDAFGGKLSSTISYYYIKVQDILRQDPAHTQFQIQNGTQVSKGFEAEVIANPFEGFNAVLGFSYNDSRYINATADVDGRRPATASSPYLGNFWLSYRVMHGEVKGLGFGIGGNYASENHIVNSASLGVFSLPSYTILNASAFYDVKKYRLGLKCDNFTNQKYWTGYTTMNPQQLISVVGSVAYKF